MPKRSFETMEERIAQLERNTRMREDPLAAAEAAYAAQQALEQKKKEEAEAKEREERARELLLQRKIEELEALQESQFKREAFLQGIDVDKVDRALVILKRELPNICNETTPEHGVMRMNVLNRLCHIIESQYNCMKDGQLFGILVRIVDGDIHFKVIYDSYTPEDDEESDDEYEWRPLFAIYDVDVCGTVEEYSREGSYVKYHNKMVASGWSSMHSK